MNNSLSAFLGRLSILGVLIAVSASSMAAPLERHRAFYRDRWVEYVERNGLAITDRDILLGTAAELSQMRDASTALKGLIIDQASLLWPVGPSGVHEVPYVFEAGSQFNVEAAVVLFNAALRDTIRFVPRSAQKDYVAFSLTEPGSGSCFSYVGRIGGKQIIGGEPDCPVGPLLHEMGHAIGFWHTMSDAAQGSYLNIRYDIMDPLWRRQYVPELDARTVDGYDYASIMHYEPFVNSTSPDLLTASTLPAGIDIGQTNGYSAGDIDAVKRLYGQVPVAVTITTHPPGLKVVVDGVTRITPWVAWWRMGSLHRLDVASTVQDYGTFKAAFGRWSHDPSAAPKTFQEWIVEPGRGFASEPVSSPRATVLTANFVRLVEVQSVGGGGTHGELKVTPEVAPWPGTTNYFPQYTRFDLSATPAPGYLTEWYTSPTFIPMTGGDGGVTKASRRIGAASPTQIGATFVKGPGIVLQTAGTGDDGTLQVGVAVPGYGDTYYAFNAPTVIDSTYPSGTYKMIARDRYRTATVRFVPQSIKGLDNDTTGAIASPGPGQDTKTVTFAFQKQFYPLVQLNPECGGTVILSGPEDYTATGTMLSATATPGAGITFAGWNGTVSGLANKVTMTVDRVPEFYADFNAINEPLRLTKISPAAYSPGQGQTVFEFTGSGFTSKTIMVFADGRRKSAQLVNSKTLRVTLSEADFPVQGKVVATLATALTSTCAAESAPVVIDVAPIVTAQKVTVREFYNPALDRYFITANDNEGRAIEVDPFSQERATGLTFKAWATDAYPAGASVVYRFYGSPDPGPNSHFLTANVSEARALQRAELDTPSTSKRWNYEEMSFAIKTPQNFVCPADAPVQIYRAYNNGFKRGVDSNHRLLNDASQYAQMIANGWIGEGVVMCGPR